MPHPIAAYFWHVKHLGHYYQACQVRMPIANIQELVDCNYCFGTKDLAVEFSQQSGMSPYEPW
jgi:hypothetical protein